MGRKKEMHLERKRERGKEKLGMDKKQAFLNHLYI